MADQFNLTALAVGALGLVGTAASWVVNRRPAQADYAAKLLDSTVPAYEQLAKRLAAVELQNQMCEERNDRLEEKCDRMVQYLRSVGLDPDINPE